MLKRLLSKIHTSLLLELNMFNYYLAYRKYFSKESSNKKGIKQLEGWILQDKHRIEKAFSLPKPKEGFGEAVLFRLIGNVKKYVQLVGKDEVYYIALGVIKAYKHFHEISGYKIPSFYANLIEGIEDIDFENEQCNLAGFRIQESSESKDFKEIMENRYSCRNFSNEKIIDESILEEIIRLSIKAPSVCNRQHWRVHFFSGKKKNQILKFQNGNSGFTDNIPMIALITSDLNAFYTSNEHHQPYVDGGIFTMNFLYALEVNGLKGCALNWCNSYRDDMKLRRLGFLLPSEVVIVAIAIGYANEKIIVAKSPRLPTKKFYEIHK